MTPHRPLRETITQGTSSRAETLPRDRESRLWFAPMVTTSLPPLPQPPILQFSPKAYLFPSPPITPVSKPKHKPQHHLSFAPSASTQFLQTPQFFLPKRQENSPTYTPTESLSSSESQVIYDIYVELLPLAVRYCDIALIRAVHALVLKAEEDNYLQNSLVSAYLKLGFSKDAYNVFMGISSPDVVSFTGFISYFAKAGCEFLAVSVFNRMRKSGIVPNGFTFVALLTACSRMVELELGVQVHALLVKFGYFSCSFVANTLMGMYRKCGCLSSVLRLFDEMPERDVASWNTVIAGLVDEMFCERAFSLFCEMQDVDGLRADHFTFSTLLNACAGSYDFRHGREVHAYALKMGFGNSLDVNNALVGFYTKCGSIEDVHALFERMPVRDIFTWTGMITAYMEFGMVSMAVDIFEMMPETNSISYNAVLAGLCQNGEGFKALDFFSKMLLEGVELTDFTLTSILSACSLLAEKDISEQIHGFVIKFRFGSNAHVKAALLYMCTRCGRMTDARKMFYSSKCDLNSSVNWTSMICGYARNGLPVEAISLFHRGLVERTMVIDEVTSTVALGLFGTLGFRTMGKQIHCHALKSGFVDDLGVGNAIISMYSECGEMIDAIKAFNTMSIRDVVSWNALISGHILHRQGDEALSVWSKMEKARTEGPDLVTFVLVITSYKYTQTDLVNDCWRMFHSMRTTYKLEATSEHYASLVSVLGYWGYLEEAESTIAKMPIVPEPSVWRALLESCSIHSNTEIGKRTIKHILALQPQDPATFILLSNLYSASGRWHCAETLRDDMRKKGMRKHSAQSWIVFENAIHGFHTRDKSHAQSKDIYKGLEILILECLKVGYVPDTSFVLHEVEEHQKKEFLFYHGAKLAVTYGLLMTKAGNTIRVAKSVKLCGDCHNFLKYASVVTKRDICVKDPSGFHWFRYGECPCNDYR